MIGLKIQAYRVNAVPFIGWSVETLSFKNMAKVSIALGASHLGTNHTHGIVSVQIDCPGNCLVKCGPSAA